MLPIKSLSLYLLFFIRHNRSKHWLYASRLSTFPSSTSPAPPRAISEPSPTPLPPLSPTEKTIKSTPLKKSTKKFSSSKRYLSTSLKQCATMHIKCRAGEQVFTDSKGCGCEKLSSFPFEEPDKSLCTQEYAPVCGEIQVYCVRAPCPRLFQTFNNKCLAESIGAKNITTGICPKEDDEEEIDWQEEF